MKFAVCISILGLSAVLLAGSSTLAADAVTLPQERSVDGGSWMDDGPTYYTQTLVVKALSDAYFRILELHPEVNEFFRLGNNVVWITPSRTVLVINTSEGKERLSDEEIEKLFLIARR